MHKISNLDIRNDHRGIALVTVLLVMLVLTILTTGVVVIGISNYKQTNTTIDHNQAYYIAEAGVNYQVEKLIEKLKSYNVVDVVTMSDIKTWAITVSNTVPIDLTPEDGSNANGGFTSKILVPDITKYIVNIESVGTVANISRTLKKSISITGFKIDRAILTSGELNINKADIFLNPTTTKIYGEVQSLSLLENSIKIDKLANLSVVYIKDPTPQTYDYVIENCNPYMESTKMMCNIEGLKFEVKYDDTIPSLPRVELPTSLIQSVPISEYPKYKLEPVQYTYQEKVKGNWVTKDFAQKFIDDSGSITIATNSVPTITTYAFSTQNSTKSMFYVPKFEIDATVGDFTIDVGDKNIEILTHRLILNGSFKLKGEGSLTVFVDSTEFTTNCTSVCGAIKETNPLVADKFIVVVTGTAGSTFKFAGNGTYYLSLITLLNMNIEMNGTWTYNGFLAVGGDSLAFTKKEGVNINGTVNGNMLIYAPTTTVSMGGNADLNGSIIAASYQSNGNSVTIHYNSNYSKPPFDFLDPLNYIVYGPTIEG